MRRLLKLLVTVLIVCGVIGVGFGLLILESEPTVDDGRPPSAEEVVEARAFVRGLRDALDPGKTNVAQFVTSEEELNSVAKLGARLVPGFRGRVEARKETVVGWGSVPLTFAGITRWLNVSIAVPTFEDEFAPSGIQLGPIPLPPQATLEIARRGADTFLGNNLGSTVLDSAASMDIRDDELVFVLTMDEVGGNGIMRGVFGSLRGGEMPPEETIMRYYTLLREAMDRGDLPRKGSYLPYVTFMLNAAYDGSKDEGVADAYTSAIFALSFVCGAQDFNLIVGGITDGDKMMEEEWQLECGQVTFNDRIDSRRHFTTAAAIQSASNRGFAVTVGEFKELYDSVKSGGFDFTDIAANNSGIRMSNLFMSASRAEWPGLIARIEAEDDIIIPFDGIPQIMSEAEFEAGYGDVESPAYLAQLADIEGRIDRLAVHR